MLTTEKINQAARELPETYQKEVLDFVEFLLHKTKNGNTTEEEQEWNDFSLASAMRGLEDDEFPEYTDKDFIEKWK